MTEESKGPELRVDDDQIQALIDLETITRKSPVSMIRESLEMYIKVSKGEAIYHLTPETMLSPMVFDTPYRRHRPEE